jgi:hypothetical protein
MHFGVRLAGTLVPASPMSLPSFTSTQPTRGFGLVEYSPRSARRSARAIH